ncbi:MAG: beta-lactamase family protein, partial [Bacteroidota bacterium]|nr:beta-lactamase family protein [Bacteroidota bacterium]
MKLSRRSLKIIIPVVAVIGSSFFIPWDIVRAWLAPTPETIQVQVNDALKYKLDGIIVYVDKKGEPPSFYAAGWKDKQNKIPADPHALFKIASISRLYIAAATAKLVYSHRLSLDDTLEDLLPELAGRIQYSKKITLRMLLQHRCGIPDWIKSSKFPWGDPPRNVDRVLDLVLDKPADFKPGSRYEYSNANYLLIGKILDKTLGYSYKQNIKEVILTPLGLTHTFGSMSEVNPNEIVSGYDSHIGNMDMK